MNRLFDFLCFSTTDWDEIWGSRQQIMSRLGKRGHRVFFIERPAGIEHLLRYPKIRKNKIKRWQEGIQNISENVWIVSLPPLFPGRYYSKNVNEINQKITWINVNKQLTGFKIESPLLWIYNPEQSPLIGKFNEQLSIYHCIDEFTAGTTGRKQRIITQLEKELISHVDIIFANSSPTYQNKKAINCNTYRLASGVDYEQFSSLSEVNEITQEFTRISHPRIGYVGHLNERIDFQLLQFLAAQRTDWSFIFIGSTFPLPPNNESIKRLNSFSNCYLLGEKPYSQIPAIISALDVCLLPFVQDERAFYRSPLKLYEYFAVGKPIVSSLLPESQEFSDVLYLADSPESFLNQIETALSEFDGSLKEQRRVIARQNSWEIKIDFIENIINTHLK